MSSSDPLGRLWAELATQKSYVKGRDRSLRIVTLSQTGILLYPNSFANYFSLLPLPSSSFSFSSSPCTMADITECLPGWLKHLTWAITLR